MRNPHIEKKIFLIRTKRVMIDRDLAELYHVPTKRLNEQVRRNLRRFPFDFMFRLTLRERLELVAKCDRFMTLKHSSTLPYAFTEQGVAMLSSILNSERAIDVNIAIMRAFVKLRHALSVRHDLVIKVEHIEGRVNLLETDVRFLREDLQNKNPKELFKPIPKIKGFDNE